jgi:malate synthase
MNKDYDVPYYLDYLPDSLLERLDGTSESVAAVEGLKVTAGLREQFPSIESDEALRFVCDLYNAMKESLSSVLNQREIDREFIDNETLAAVEKNRGVPYQSADYETVIGKQNENGDVIVGPLPKSEQPAHQVQIPDFVDGFQVTLFGPPDTAKMAINAMNALNRISPNEPDIVTELVESSKAVPRWGADNEDSQTPIMANFLNTCKNLVGCFDRSLRFEDPHNGKTYELDDEGLSIPIKRIPGLALPDGSHLLNGNPLPLHLFDFAMHLFHNWQRPEALMFYIPKLENESEAAYLRQLIETAERRIKEIHPEYEVGTVRLFIVFENPRAIFRIQEIAEALAPYFLGGSLGWHDFLGSTARLFKHDPNYRIPVKADPNIVINHIRESHHLLVSALEPINAIRIGGMYGVLYEDNNQESYEVSMVGYIKDVVTQLKRGLTGFWVAHPAFVRPGLAIVEAFSRLKANPKDKSLEQLIRALVPSQSESEPLIEFVDGPDVKGLDATDPLYQRGVLAASIATSNVIANDDPQEVRYNVFQAIQYITDWLCGNGCVALPTTMDNANGKAVFVRVMDDLATTERSRWELWAEIHHGRVSIELFDSILAEEIEFIKTKQQTRTKRPQVLWEGEAAKWYPIAAVLLRQLVTNPEPVEFATQLLMPFTFDVVRRADDPWKMVNKLCPGKYVQAITNWQNS